jgi:hypothetical protein
MSNVIDYVKWRGDISFENAPLNEIDSLIFCELAYVPFERFISNSKHGETLEILAEKFLALPENERKMGAIIPEKLITELFTLVAKSNRYKNVRLKNFVNNVCKKAEKQFCAMTFVINSEYYYIAYRGTDDNIVAWKEDFNMAFNTPIPSQTEGAEYLDAIGQKTRRQLYIGGHSKGGNVATYSALFSSDKTKKKIVSIHSFDGPGFRPDFIETLDDEVTKAKITKFLPQGSIIGVIFEPINECIYIKSKGKGMYQHDAFNWEVIGTDFVKVDGLRKSSLEFHDILLNWTISMNPEEREEFVEALFRLITVNDVSTLTDISTGKAKFFFGLFKADTKTKKVLFSAIGKLLKQKKDKAKTNNLQEQILSSSKKLK